MWVSSVLLRWPMITWRGLALVVGHVVALRSVGRVRAAGVTRTRRGYGWIYRDLGVRLHIGCIMMVILLSILQGHGRTWCLCHTSRTGVTILLLRVLLLARQVFRWKIGRTRRGWLDVVFRFDGELGGRSSGGLEIRWSHFLLRRILRSRYLIYGCFLGLRLGGQGGIGGLMQT